MTKILTIDSSTEACSVALSHLNVSDIEQHGNQQQVISRYQHAPRKHAELLLPMVDSVLTEAGLSLTDLDAIGCCVGPGAFTGLRIAISVAQGLAYAANRPCIAISSLESLAVEAFSKSSANICIASIDARMQEVYFACFKRKVGSLPELIHPEQVIAAEKIRLSSELQMEIQRHSSQTNTIAKVGTGWSEYQYCDVIESVSIIPLEVKYPDAKAMLSIADQHFQMGRLFSPEKLQPIYLRNNIAKKKSEQK